MIPVTLNTERLVLSAPTLEDAASNTELLQDPLMATMLAALPWPYRREDAEYYLGTMVPAGWQSGDVCTWGIREHESDPQVGELAWRRESADIGFWMGAPYRGKGYMTEAVRAVVPWVFATFPEIERIGWEAVAENVPSAYVARAAGFRYEGVEPASHAFRDGSHPLTWRASIRRGDDHSRGQGWPL